MRKISVKEDMSHYRVADSGTRPSEILWSRGVLIKNGGSSFCFNPQSACVVYIWFTVCFSMDVWKR